MEKEQETKNIYFKYYAFILITITVILTIERIIFYFIESDDILIQAIIDGRDGDFKLVGVYMKLGLFDFYDDGLPYFYWAYFILFPIYTLPVQVGAYVWDILRLISVLFIAKNIQKLTDDKNDILYFYIFSLIGYTVDVSLNNHNWVILFLLFESLLQLKNNRKLLSGFLFAIASYKNVVMIFPLVLLISKKIKIKDIIYYIFPLALILLPYLIFPNYTAEMFTNWHRQDSLNPEGILFLLWRITQTAQLLFMSFILFTLLTSLKRYKKEGWLLLSAFALFFYLILTIIIISPNYFNAIK